MYCNQNDLQKIIPLDRLIELTDDASPPQIVDPTNLQNAITTADATIDGYIQGKVTLPLDPVPQLIITLSAQIAAYHLWSRRPEQEAPKDVVRKFDAALAMLKDISKGFISLGANQPELASGEYKTNKTAPDRIFNSEVMSQF